MYLNKKPIFIVCFARGGSNILLNLLLSHPDVCVPQGETQQVFKGGGQPLHVRIEKILRYLPIILVEKKNIFSLNLFEKRPALSEFSKKQIDKILFTDKIKALKPGQNLYKSENIKYLSEEITNSRILCKNLNGVIFLSQEFSSMYPDATFLALVRNGFAVCEGHIRRGYQIEYIAKLYEKGCQQIIDDSKIIPNYHIIRYEDIIEKPIESLKNIYKAAQLDINQVKKIRLQTKQVINNDGAHEYTHASNEKRVIWYDINNFQKHFKKNINDNQIKRLSQNQKDIISNICKASLEYFNYL